ncbi:MAG: hypothetical protein L7U87_00905 [Chlamydiales bacterium]|nr:hypothetical protein [Chlamydiales bacterium]
MIYFRYVLTLLCICSFSLYAEFKTDRLKGYTPTISEEFIKNIDNQYIKESFAVLELLFAEMQYKQAEKDLSQEFLQLFSLLKGIYESGALDESSFTRSIAYLIWNYDQHPEEVDKLLASSDPSVFQSNLEEVAKRMKGQLYQAIEDLEKKHRAYQLQDPLLAKFVAHGRLLAKALVPKGGRVNVALAEEFILKEGEFAYPEPLTLSINQVLNELQQDILLRQVIAAAEVPGDSKGPSAKIIRMSAGLAYNAEIIETDVAREVLSSLMGNLRQDGHVGSCFATSIGIAVGRNNLRQESEDLVEIARDGYLVREIKEGEETFPFLFKMNAQLLKKAKMSIETKGDLAGQSTYKKNTFLIWEEPSAEAIFTYLGIDKSQEFIVKALSPLKKRRNGLYSFYDIVRAIVRQYANDNPEKKAYQKELIDELVYVYRSQADHPLQRAWENILSAMAEGRGKSIFKRKGVKNTMSVISRKMSALAKDLRLGAGESSDVKGALSSAMRKEMQRRVKMMYDPTLPWESKSLDGSSANGAFVLYGARDYSNPFEWKRLDTAKEFSAFMDDILEKVAPQVRGNFESAKTKEALDKMQVRVSEYLESDAFEKDILKRYNSRGGNKRYKKSPWIARSGHHPNSVLKVYRGKKMKKVTSKPATSHDLFDEVTILSLKYGKKLKSEFEQNPEFSVPMTSPHHAFTTMMGKGKIAEGWKSQIDFKKMKNEFLVFPGLDLASATMDSSIKEKVIKFVAKKLPKKAKRNFSREAKDFEDGLSYKEFYRKSFDIISKASKNPKLKKALPSFFDTAFYKYLDEEKVRAMPKIFFADTNWNMGGNDSYFAFVMSLATGDLIVASVSDDQGKVHVQSQESSFFIKPGWEYFKAGHILLDD